MSLEHWLRKENLTSCLEDLVNAGVVEPIELCELSENDLRNILGGDVSLRKRIMRSVAKLTKGDGQHKADVSLVENQSERLGLNLGTRQWHSNLKVNHTKGLTSTFRVVTPDVSEDKDRSHSRNILDDANIPLKNDSVQRLQEYVLKECNIRSQRARQLSAAQFLKETSNSKASRSKAVPHGNPSKNDCNNNSVPRTTVNGVSDNISDAQIVENTNSVSRTDSDEWLAHSSSWNSHSRKSLTLPPDAGSFTNMKHLPSSNVLDSLDARGRKSQEFSDIPLEIGKTIKKGSNYSSQRNNSEKTNLNERILLLPPKNKVPNKASPLRCDLRENRARVDTSSFTDLEKNRFSKPKPIGDEEVWLSPRIKASSKDTSTTNSYARIKMNGQRPGQCKESTGSPKLPNVKRNKVKLLESSAMLLAQINLGKLKDDWSNDLSGKSLIASNDQSSIEDTKHIPKYGRRWSNSTKIQTQATYTSDASKQKLRAQYINLNRMKAKQPDLDEHTLSADIKSDASDKRKKALRGGTLPKNSVNESPVSDTTFCNDKKTLLKRRRSIYQASNEDYKENYTKARKPSSQSRNLTMSSGLEKINSPTNSRQNRLKFRLGENEEKDLKGWSKDGKKIKAAFKDIALDKEWKKTNHKLENAAKSKSSHLSDSERSFKKSQRKSSSRKFQRKSNTFTRRNIKTSKKRKDRTTQIKSSPPASRSCSDVSKKCSKIKDINPGRASRADLIKRLNEEERKTTARKAKQRNSKAQAFSKYFRALNGKGVFDNDLPNIDGEYDALPLKKKKTVVPWSKSRDLASYKNASRKLDRLKRAKRVSKNKSNNSKLNNPEVYRSSSLREICRNYESWISSSESEASVEWRTVNVAPYVPAQIESDSVIVTESPQNHSLRRADNDEYSQTCSNSSSLSSPTGADDESCSKKKVRFAFELTTTYCESDENWSDLPEIPDKAGRHVRSRSWDKSKYSKNYKHLKFDKHASYRNKTFNGKGNFASDFEQLLKIPDLPSVVNTADVTHAMKNIMFECDQPKLKSIAQSKITAAVSRLKKRCSVIELRQPSSNLEDSNIGNIEDHISKSVKFRDEIHYTREILQTYLMVLIEEKNPFGELEAIREELGLCAKSKGAFSIRKRTIESRLQKAEGMSNCMQNVQAQLRFNIALLKSCGKTMETDIRHWDWQFYLLVNPKTDMVDSELPVAYVEPYEATCKKILQRYHGLSRIDLQCTLFLIKNYFTVLIQLYKIYAGLDGMLGQGLAGMSIVIWEMCLFSLELPVKEDDERQLLNIFEQCVESDNKANESKNDGINGIWFHGNEFWTLEHELGEQRFTGYVQSDCPGLIEGVVVNDSAIKFSIRWKKSKGIKHGVANCTGAISSDSMKMRVRYRMNRECGIWELLKVEGTDETQSLEKMSLKYDGFVDAIMRLAFFIYPRKEPWDAVERLIKKHVIPKALRKWEVNLDDEALPSMLMASKNRQILLDIFQHYSVQRDPPQGRMLTYTKWEHLIKDVTLVAHQFADKISPPSQDIKQFAFFSSKTLFAANQNAGDLKELNWPEFLDAIVKLAFKVVLIDDNDLTFGAVGDRTLILLKWFDKIVNSHC